MSFWVLVSCKLLQVNIPVWKYVNFQYTMVIRKWRSNTVLFFSIKAVGILWLWKVNLLNSVLLKQHRTFQFAVWQLLPMQMFNSQDSLCVVEHCSLTASVFTCTHDIISQSRPLYPNECHREAECHHEKWGCKWDMYIKIYYLGSYWHIPDSLFWLSPNCDPKKNLTVVLTWCAVMLMCM